MVADCPPQPARVATLARGAQPDGNDDVLLRCPIFEVLSEADATALRGTAVTVELSRGDRLFSEGDDGDSLYIIISGKMKLTRRAAPDGRENLVSLHGAGEMFGELPMFDPGPRESGAIAVTDARLAAMRHDDMRRWLTSHPEVALQLLRALAGQLRRISEIYTDLVFTDVPGRVAKALLELAGRFGLQQADGLQVNHDLTQEELAQLVGASRETVNKALADFAARGWIALSAKSVLLLDAERLRRRAR